MINVDNITTFKVSEKKNKVVIVLKLINGSVRKFNFRHIDDFESFEKELISKMDNLLEKKKFDPDMRIEKQN